MSHESSPIEDHRAAAVTRCDRKYGTVLTPMQLTAVLEIMDSDFETAPDVRTFARASGLSPLHFSRVFKGTTGLPPKRFFNQRLLHRAAVLLKTGNYRVEEVCYEIGFRDPAYFSRSFRRFFRQPPSRFVQNNRATTPTSFAQSILVPNS